MDAPTRNHGGVARSEIGSIKATQGPLAPAANSLHIPSENNQSNTPINCLEQPNHLFGKITIY